MTTPTKGATRASKAIREYMRQTRGDQWQSADQERIAGLVDRAIGLPALITAIQACMEFWDNGTAVQASALVVGELRYALQDATGDAGARWPGPSTDEVLPYVFRIVGGGSANPIYCRAVVKDEGAGRHQCNRKPSVYLAGWGFCKRHAEAVRQGVDRARADLEAKGTVYKLREA